MDLDDILIQLGKRGKWQILTYVMVVSSIYILLNWQIFAIVFMAAVPQAMHCNIPVNHTKNSTLPPDKKDPGKGTLDRCLMYRNLTYPDIDQTIPCPNGWDYTKDFESSIVTEFDLVCNREFDASFVHVISVLGALAGAFILTPFSDYFGRKPMFIITIWLTAASGVGVAFAPSYDWLLVFQFFRGFFFQGGISAGLVMACELFASDQRVIAGILTHAFWAFGLVTLAAWGTLLRNWRHFMLGISIPAVLTVINIWLVPESIQWLVSVGKLDKAKVLLLRAAKMNGVPFDTAVLDASAASNKATYETQYKSVLSVCYARKFWIYNWILIFLWLAVNLGYWGLSLGTANLSGDIYSNFAINGAVEFPAIILCLIALPRWGRRRTLFATQIVSAVGMVAMVVILTAARNESDVSGAVTAMAMLGKFGVCASYLNLVFYTPEVYPTTHRNLGMGVCFVMGIVAGVVAPYLVVVARYLKWLPNTVIAVLSILSGASAILLPETVHRPLPATIEEVQKWTLNISKEEKNEFIQAIKIKRENSEQSLRDYLNGLSHPSQTSAPTRVNTSTSIEIPPPPAYTEIDIYGSHINRSFDFTCL